MDPFTNYDKPYIKKLEMKRNFSEAVFNKIGQTEKFSLPNKDKSI